MKIVPRLVLAVCGVVGLDGRAAEPFSQAVPPAEFNAAGLDKLTPAELTRLDALVQRYHAGELEAARRKAAAEAEAKAVEQVRAAKAEAEARVAAQVQAAKAEAATTRAQKTAQNRDAKDGSIAGFFSSLTRPVGTKAEFDKAGIEIVGVFKGYHPGTVFVLGNGQRWRVLSDTYVTGPMPEVRRVLIEPGMLGSFYLRFEGVGVQPKVSLVSEP